MAAKTLMQSGVLFTDRRDFYVSPYTYKKLWTDVAPFTTICMPMQDAMVPDPDFKMFESRTQWRKMDFTIVNAAATWSGGGTGLPNEVTTGLTLSASNGLNLTNGTTVDASLKGLEVHVYSAAGVYKGHAFVYDTPSNTSITLKSLGKVDVATFAWGANLVTGDVCEVIGSAFGELSTAGESIHGELHTIWNSCQIQRTPVHISGTLKANTKLRGYSNELARIQDESGESHKIKMERMNLLGIRPYGIGSQFDPNTMSDPNWATGGTEVTDADGHRVRTTMGLISVLKRYGDSSDTSDTQNVFNRQFATYSYSQFCDDMEKVFQYDDGRGVRSAFCSPNVLAFFNKMDAKNGFVGNSGWQVQLSDIKRDKLGFNFKIMEAIEGVLRMVRASVLRGYYTGYMVIPYLSDCGVATYRPNAYRTNVKTDDDYDGQKDVYFSDNGFRIQLPEKHCMFVFK